MNLIKKYLWMFFLMAIAMQQAQAIVVDDLYSVEIAVADQTTSSRLDAFSQAFKLVVIKVSGSDDALQSSAFKRPAENSARYVKQFRYISRKSDDQDEYETERIFLRVDFNQQLIEGLLRQNNFPVWGQERPNTLLVISYDVNERIQLVSSDTTPELVELLDRATQYQGLPVLFPLMDLEDLSLVSVSDITSREFDNIGILATRYSPDAIVVGQVIGRSGEGWSGDWEVRFADQIFKWDYKSASKQEIVDQLVKHLARILALEYALEDHPRNEQELLLSVVQLNGLENLIYIQNYLKSLNAVDSVRVTLISETSVTFRLQLRNSAEDLQRLIEFGAVLEQQELPLVDAQAGNEVILNYSYSGRRVSN